jgi:hypothetical protein
MLAKYCPMAFREKHLDFEIILQGGMFGSGGGNTSRITGARASVTIANAGGRDMGRMEAAIYGLSQSEMNQLTTYGTQSAFVEKNGIKVYAYETGQAPELVFAGTISSGFGDYRGMPLVPFRVAAHAGLHESVQKEEPTSRKGTSDAKQAFQELAGKMGLSFEGNDVDFKIPNLYLYGSPRHQAMQLAEMLGLQWTIENETLAIWKAGEVRGGGAFEVSKYTGLVGYPSFNQAGVEITVAFTTAIKLGQKINVQSEILPACGEWSVLSLVYELESETPGGKWFAIMAGQRINGPDPAGG